MRYLFALVMAVGAFLTVAYFSNFITRAEYNEDKIVVAIIKTKLENLEKGQIEIKNLLR